MYFQIINTLIMYSMVNMLLSSGRMKKIKQQKTIVARATHKNATFL